MRLGTWNCCLQFGTNLHHLLALEVDVAVVCEAQAVDVWPSTAGGRTVSGITRPVGQGGQKHLAVIGCRPWTMTPHPELESAPPWTLPVLVDGPVPFTMLALWPVKAPGWPADYVQQIEHAVGWLEEQPIDGPVVVAGDFNAPIAESRARYARVVERFSALGLVDAYLTARDLGPDGVVPEATYYHWRRQGLPFHIDHVMLPKSWANDAQVEIGDFESWVASGRSDHVPVVVDVAEI